MSTPADRAPDPRTPSGSPSVPNTPSGSASGKRIAFTALLAAVALIFSYVEVLIPLPVGIPGVKLGIANLVVLIALYEYGMKPALAVNLIRILVAGLLFTGLFGAVYSLAGAALSLLVMALLKRTGLFSVVGVSMAGGVAHNIGQLLVAAALISDLRIFLYLPVLMFSGLVSGILIGFLCWYVLRALAPALRHINTDIKA
ncbi:MAG: Gx transporter family protein [Clostridia bacterium]|nr:Gx transporter family protein [Clostridia bacterium]